MSSIKISPYKSKGDDCDTFTCTCKYLPMMSYDIWTAAEKGDLNEIVRRTNIDRKVMSKLDEYGYTPLHYASQNNHYNIVEYLLSNGIKPDINTCGATPLHRAAYNGSYESCELLLKYGADVNALDTSFKENSTPLHKASSQGATLDSIITLLIKYNADINIKDRYGKIPMDLYIEQNLKNQNEENKNIFPIKIANNNHNNNNNHKKQSTLFKNNLFCQPISIVNSNNIKNKKKKQDIICDININKDKVNDNNNSLSLGILCNFCNKYSLAFTRVRGSLICTTCKFNMSQI